MNLLRMYWKQEALLSRRRATVRQGPDIRSCTRHQIERGMKERGGGDAASSYFAVNTECLKSSDRALGEVGELDASDSETSLGHQLQQLEVAGGGVTGWRGEVGGREDEARGLSDG